MATLPRQVRICCYNSLRLYKAFVCLPYELNLAKLQAHGMDSCSVKVLKSYLSNPYQSIKRENTFSLWLKVLGVPQGSIAGPFLLNIFLNDFFSQGNRNV